MFLKTFLNLLSNTDHDIPNFPRTILYNEGWLLRLLVDWFSKSGVTKHPLSFPKDGHWFSEARLPSAFLPRFKGDPVAESHTNADGVIGHITIGSKGKTDLELTPDATHFVVLEAKLYSGLSKGVTNAKYYDQAARNVACIAEVLSRADCKPTSFAQLGFYVLAPKDQIKSRTFRRHLDKQSIKNKVSRRKSSYVGEKADWFKDWFKPTLEVIDVRSISWESVLHVISERDSKISESLIDYYSLCLRFNL
ncbi:MAG: hypothetical protein WBF08_06485 [Candidatus Bathyarchaeia archaeon]